MPRSLVSSIIVVFVASFTALVLLRLHQLPSHSQIWIGKGRGFLAWMGIPLQASLPSSFPTDAAVAATVRTHVLHLSNMFSLVLACGSPFFAVFNETYASDAGHFLQRDIELDGPDAAVVELGKKLERLTKITNNRADQIGAEFRVLTYGLAPGGQFMYQIEQSIEKLVLIQQARERLANPILGTAQERDALHSKTNSLLLTVLPDLCLPLMVYLKRLLSLISQSVSEFEPAVPSAQALLQDFTAERQAVQQSISALPWYDFSAINVVLGVKTQGGALRKKSALLDRYSKHALEHAERFVIVHENLKNLHDYMEWYVPYANSTIAGPEINSIHHRYYESELSHTRKLAYTLQQKAATAVQWWNSMKVLAYPPHHVPQSPALNGPQTHKKEASTSGVSEIPPSPN